MIRMLASIAAAAWLAASAWAATPDHLRCYKVKDSAAKASYSADLTGLTPGTSGCMIKLPGSLLCVEAEKTNVDPVPPVEGSGPSAGQFLCYKVKCPKAVVPSISWTDQFGSRQITPLTSKLVCAPAIAPSTSTSTSTTTSVTGLSTTFVPPPCTPGVEGQACGSCGSGLCGVHCGASGLACFSNAGPSCDTSVSCTSDTNCSGGKVCISSPGAFCSEAFCCDPCP
jgi:hypothetical protein